MAKLKGLGAMGGNRTASLGRAFTIYEWRGQICVRLKKNKTKPKTSPAREHSIDNFRELAKAAKRITTLEYESAVAMTKGSQYLWRDVYYMALTGRLFQWFDEEGNRYMSQASRATMSAALDALGTQNYGLMIRQPQFWDVLPPGEVGYVLVSGGPDLPPYWAEGGGGGGGTTFATGTGEDIGTNNSATKGNLLKPYIPVIVTWLNPWAGWVAGRTYEARVYESDGTSLGALLSSSTPQTPGSSFTGPLPFQLDSAVPMLDGEFYVTLFCQTSGSNTSNSRGCYQTDDLSGWPAAINTEAISLAKADPQPGDLLDFRTGFVHNIGLQFTA